MDESLPGPRSGLSELAAAHPELFASRVAPCLPVAGICRLGSCSEALWRVVNEYDELWVRVLRQRRFSPHPHHGHGWLLGTDVVDTWAALDVEGLSVKALKQACRDRRAPTAGLFEKAEYQAALRSAAENDAPPWHFRALGRADGDGPTGVAGGGVAAGADRPRCEHKRLFFAVCAAAAQSAALRPFEACIFAVDRKFVGSHTDWDGGRWTPRWVAVKAGGDCAIFEDAALTRPLAGWTLDGALHSLAFVKLEDAGADHGQTCCVVIRGLEIEVAFRPRSLADLVRFVDHLRLALGLGAGPPQVRSGVPAAARRRCRDGGCGPRGGCAFARALAAAASHDTIDVDALAPHRCLRGPTAMRGFACRTDTLKERGHCLVEERWLAQGTFAQALEQTACCSFVHGDDGGVDSCTAVVII